MLSLLAICSLLVVTSGVSLKQDQPNKIIVNGYSAEEGKAPYIVSLRMDGSYVCGGSIIGNEWVITAAHCVSSANSVEINYGSNWGWKGEFTHTVDKSNIIVYPEYAQRDGTDIALIRTPHVEFSGNKVNKVSLPSLNERDEHYEKWWAVACGWGGMADGNLAEWLQCMDVQITTIDECKNAYNQVGYADSFICTSDKASSGDRKSVCGGDSGGPLVTHDNPRLVGITALVYAGCNEGPSGFTRVSAYVDWIRDKTGISY